VDMTGLSSCVFIAFNALSYHTFLVFFYIETVNNALICFVLYNQMRHCTIEKLDKCVTYAIFFVIFRLGRVLGEAQVAVIYKETLILRGRWQHRNTNETKTIDQHNGQR
jgi:hypothetical protein